MKSRPAVLSGLAPRIKSRKKVVVVFATRASSLAERSARLACTAQFNDKTVPTTNATAATVTPANIPRCRRAKRLRTYVVVAGREYEDKRPLQRYVDESRRLLDVLDSRLEGRTWILGDDYSIADVASLGWVRNLIGFYEAGELVGFDTLKNVPAWLERGLARPAVQRGLTIPS